MSDFRTPRRPELLAPAGDERSLAAALAAGADAVYFGLDSGLNARARATNFSDELLGATVARIHRAGARAYLTLNTLVFERELPTIESLVRQAARAGVDALIVQDPAVALLARAAAPTLEVHASTQMTISSREGAAFAAGLGATRVVVPRELSVDEIARLAGGPLKLEVFVHGALCMSWSGQCLTSEAWGGRSANRGQCAQSCRLPYDLVVDGAVRDLGDVQYLLSPKDLAGAGAIEALARAGVHGLKIEGRQKDAEYVATAVEGYGRWLDALFQAGAEAGEIPAANLAAIDHAPAVTSPDRTRAEARLRRDLAEMALAYSRGFGGGFLAGGDHQTLVDGRAPRHRGLYLGRVTGVDVGGRRVHVVRDAPPARPTARPGPDLDPPPLRAGMGVVFDDSRPQDQDDEQGGPIFAVYENGENGERGDRVTLGFGVPGPDLRAVRPGQRVWITGDPNVARAAERLIARGEPEGRIGLRLVVAGEIGRPLRIRAEVIRIGRRFVLHAGIDAGSCTAPCIEIESEIPLAPASGPGLDRALLADKLGALGGTCFHLDGGANEIDIRDLAPGLHLPVSALKRLRRRIVEALLPAVERGPVHGLAPAPQLDAVRAAARARYLAHHGAAADAIAGEVKIERAIAGEMKIAKAIAGEMKPAAARPLLVPLCRTDAQLEAVIACGRDRLPEVELDWMELVGLGRAVERARAAGLRVVIATPRVQKPGEEGYDARIARLAPDGVLVRHWGALMHFASAGEIPSTISPEIPAPSPEIPTSSSPAPRPVVHGDFSLNVTNSVTAHHLLALGLDTITAAHDLDAAQLLDLLAAVGPAARRFAVTVHHHIPTFHTEHCVYAHLLSEGRDFHTCGRPCEQHAVALRDRTGQVHPVVVDVACRNTVFNAQAQSAASLAPQLVAAGVARLRVELVREDRDDTARVLAAWLDLLDARITPPELLRRVGVHEQFGLTRGTMRVIG